MINSDKLYKSIDFVKISNGDISVHKFHKFRHSHKFENHIQEGVK